ncbi:hypothetical protein TNCV_755131 [Trichonephila clavipes]|nr:hypothetical protein TNCV_755131 [Trichonephila clavipes]
MQHSVSQTVEGHGSLLVKVSDRVWHVTSSRPEPLKTHRVGEQCTLKSVESSNVLDERGDANSCAALDT